jgi:uncharacterized protein (DUF362 family)
MVRGAPHDRHPTPSRRRFLGQIVGAAASAGAARLVSAGEAEDRQRAQARVVVVRDLAALDPSARPQPKVLAQMIERGLCRLTGKQNSAEAWRQLLSPDDVVGLKVNCLGGPRLCTHPALADAVAASLTAAGFPADRIVIWDRTDGELTRCGFRVSKEGPGRRCFGTPEFEPRPIEVAGIETRLSRLATERTTAMINLPVLKTHTLAGFSGALKNELGCVNNARDFHGEQCRAAADISALDAIAKKRRLVICDALRPLFDKGPMDMPRCRWVHGALLFATDPVAADLVGREILEEKRKAVRGGQPWPLLPPATHLERAVELGLGTPDLASVERIDA